MELKTINAELLAKMFKQGTVELNKNKGLVDSLNVFPVPDGDTGTNMSLTMNSAIEGLTKQSFETVEEVSKSISKGSLMGARGNSGVILSQIFRGFAKGCKGKTELTSTDLCIAFKDAADTAYSAVLKPVEGTILTVIRKIADKSMEYVHEDLELVDLMKLLIKIGEETLELTPEYLPVLKQAGVVDAGGKGLICILQGCLDAMQGVESSFDAIKTEEESIMPAQNIINTDDIEFAYCTEFIIEGDSMNGQELRQIIEKMGDSMVFVQDDDLIKVHVHTNNPGTALEEALKYGSLKKVKIENMRDQHSTIIEGAHDQDKLADKVEDKKDVNAELPYEEDYGFIGVAMGDGFVNIFKDLGIHGSITGGQTMNPSTEDFMKEIANCPSKHIFIFPNNSNIIMAANQAKELSDKDVYVIPSKTMPQCITAMLEFDRDKSADENYQAMVQSLSNVKTIQITYSVRNTTFNDLAIEKDDYLAVADGEIKGVGKEIKNVILDSIKNTINDDSEILSLYYGSDVTKQDAEEIVDVISEAYPELEIDIYSGGQPIYYYVCSIE
ncbi:DAK2 domain-containing protein [Fusibacter bizertensis]|uniref:DAK2 domain-containing protein n=1 Tax=Fusibacter bizertensis TaxID=1488331 RepID=A0ABT6N8D2_9FIRM|nr:DAK2 domain-containing protein [Fusibacter bizertensis]MDH8676669.1 DAK2 domain-containing protein [Fusibacter bizertensis]